MGKVANTRDAEIAVATIMHNLQCIEEAEQLTKEDYQEEKKRLKRLLKKYERML